MKPLLLDLFCGAGGAAKGYADAGFQVIGVDLNPQPRYPFEFYQADALDWLGAMNPDAYDAIHASPPCQRYSRLGACHPGSRANHPDLVEPVRQRLRTCGVPWVIENVINAPLIDPVVLCGTSFGLRVWHHRLFESSFPIQPLPCKHNGHAMNPHNWQGRERMFAEFGRDDPEKVWRAEKGVGWMKGREGRQAIPPVFTEYIGKHLSEVIGH